MSEPTLASPVLAERLSLLRTAAARLLGQSPAHPTHLRRQPTGPTGAFRQWANEEFQRLRDRATPAHLDASELLEDLGRQVSGGTLGADGARQTYLARTYPVSRQRELRAAHARRS